MTWLREFRLIPLALVAVASLLALKLAGLVLDGGYTLGQRLDRSERIVVTTVPAEVAAKLRSETQSLDLAAPPPPGTKPWAQDMLNYPDVTGSVPSKPAAEPAKKPAEPPAAKPPAAKPPDTKPAAQTPAAEPPKSVSAAERAVLERLQERRLQLDARARELDMRENLLKAAEQKLDRPGPDPKNPTAQPNAAVAAKDQSELGRFKSLVTMYETMKPKDAAKIFDRLDIKVLIEVSSLLNARKMAEILALMSPEAAERLTVELATRARNPGMAPSPAELPKIEGKPVGG